MDAVHTRGAMVADLDELFELLYSPGIDEGPTKATSLRLPERLHRAVTIATELGMDESFTAATTEALIDRMRAFARQEAIAAHFEMFPDDVPRSRTSRSVA